MSIEKFYKGKRVLVTGHTGFKGTWICGVLRFWGAQVTGYALEPPTSPSLFTISGMESGISSIIGDIRDFEHLKSVFDETHPEIVIHMAAQPLVRESYLHPVYTYETNVMGTAHVLECIRLFPCVQSFINVTTDKVYKNKEWIWGYREEEELNGYDPYSNSKSCSELITDSYRNSFFVDRKIAVSTVRAGNVIGGGDFAKDRIIPDCVRAASKGERIQVRNSQSTRPYQHVLEPVLAYLLLAWKQYENAGAAGCYNVGPEESGCCTTGDLVELFCETWNACFQTDITWTCSPGEGPHEANYLRLDCSKIKSCLGWHPIWNIHTALDRIVQWNCAYFRKDNMRKCMEGQIEDYINHADMF